MKVEKIPSFPEYQVSPIKIPRTDLETGDHLPTSGGEDRGEHEGKKETLLIPQNTKNRQSTFLSPA